LPVDKTTMETMGISLDTPLEVTLTGNTMVVTPVYVGLPKEKVDSSLRKMRRHYGKTLKNLAK
jgi:hypothetical protein